MLYSVDFNLELFGNTYSPIQSCSVHCLTYCQAPLLVITFLYECATDCPFQCFTVPTTFNCKLFAPVQHTVKLFYTLFAYCPALLVLTAHHKFTIQIQPTNNLTFSLDSSPFPPNRAPKFLRIHMCISIHIAGLCDKTHFIQLDYVIKKLRAMLHTKISIKLTNKMHQLILSHNDIIAKNHLK